MARLRRATAQYVRKVLMRKFRAEKIPMLVRAVAVRLADSSAAWGPFSLSINLDEIRPGVQMMEAIPSVGRPKKLSDLERYEAELRQWKRTRSIARTKVAKYARLVRYHRQRKGEP